MENKMILKKYDVDYSFIIKNYLNPEMWQKTWTLFEYKKFIIQLQIFNIYTQDMKITFEIKITDNNKSWLNRSKNFFILFSLKIDDVNFLKRKINNSIIELIKSLEKDFYIEQTDEYRALIELSEEEKQKLTEIAEEFLNDNNIKSENIREAYIDAYVDENEKVYYLLKDYKINRLYKELPDFYLAFAKATNNKDLENDVLEVNNEDMENLLEQIKEFEEYFNSEEYEDDVWLFRRCLRS